MPRIGVWGGGGGSGTTDSGPLGPAQYVDHVDTEAIGNSDVGKIHTMTAAVAKTLTLPASAGVTEGSQLLIRKLGAGGLTIAKNGADTIEGSADSLVNSTTETEMFVRLVLKGTDWKIYESAGTWA